MGCGSKQNVLVLMTLRYLQDKEPKILANSTIIFGSIPDSTAELYKLFLIIFFIVQLFSSISTSSPLIGLWFPFVSRINIFVKEKYSNPFRKYICFCHITTLIGFLRKMLLAIYYIDIKHARVVLILNTRHPKMWVSNSKNQFMTACEMVVKKFAWFETENILKSYFFLREGI